MKIGIELRSLQNGSKYRGIGEVVKQVTNRAMVMAARDGHEMVFYEYDGGDNPKELLDIPKDLKYSVVKQGPNPDDNPTLTRLQRFKNTWRALFGEPVVGSCESDVFFQCEYSLGVPRNTRTVLVKHDLIPLLFWDLYMDSPWRHWQHKALRTGLRVFYKNYHWKRVLRRSVRNADTIIAVSNQTKKDLESLLHVSPRKVEVVYNGVSIQATKTGKSETTESKMLTKPYLLFVGVGADERRRVGDLVDAFNNLKADGHDIQLALVGSSLDSAEELPDHAAGLRNSIINSSYRDDILMMGYVDDDTKQKLFHEALAFVFPTLYEGFGIPILEAFLLGCPVIAYKNSSIPEVGGDYAIYVNDWWGIKKEVEKLLVQDKRERRKNIDAAKKHAEKFTWDKTAKKIYEELVRET